MVQAAPQVVTRARTDGRSPESGHVARARSAHLLAVHRRRTHSVSAEMTRAEFVEIQLPRVCMHLLLRLSCMVVGFVQVQAAAAQSALAQLGTDALRACGSWWGPTVPAHRGCFVDYGKGRVARGREEGGKKGERSDRGRQTESQRERVGQTARTVCPALATVPMPRCHRGRLACMR